MEEGGRKFGEKVPATDAAGIPRTPRQFLAATIAYGFGSGLMRPAPGSWGSALAVLLAWPILASQGITALAIAFLLALVIGLWAVGVVEERESAHDAPEIVIDEIAGQWLTLLVMVMAARAGLIAPLDGIDAGIAGFVAFRIFDIWKPGPIGHLDERVQGALGTMLDDLAAGLAAGIVVVLGAYAWNLMMPAT
ncbi:MAG: phosphatidylglycerophosphatase A [Alphaproteobacteria bacterium]|nr:MAG: phosphatidylglycerophosphatase A [Alphaproteobacteria bacterium]